MYPIKIKTKINAYTKAAGIFTNNENIIGNGTELDPLDLAYTPDEITIVKIGEEKNKLSAVALLDENYNNEDEILPKSYSRLPNPITATSIRHKFEEVDLNIQKNAAGGYLPSKDFGVDTPSQEDLTNWALTKLGITDPNFIPNQTKVKNKFDGNIWILNNLDINGQSVFEWIDDGSDSIGVATLDTLGIVKSSEEQYKCFVNDEGVISINGLQEEIDRGRLAETYLQTNINSEVNRALKAEEYLQTNINTEVNRATTAELELKELITSNFDEINETIGELSDLKEEVNKIDPNKNVDNIVDVVISNFDEINNLTAEVSDFKQDYSKELEIINSNFNTITNKVKDLDAEIGDISKLQQTITGTDTNISNIIGVLEDHKERIIDNFDNINQAVGDISKLETSVNDITTKLDGLLSDNGNIAEDKLPFNPSDFVDLSSAQTITGEKTFNGLNLQVPGSKPIQVQAVENSNLLIKQTSTSNNSYVSIETDDTTDTQSLIISAVNGDSSSRVDITDDSISLQSEAGTEESNITINKDSVEINSKELLYNGVQVATVNDLNPEIGNLIDANGITSSFDLNNTTLKSNIQDIFKYLNNQNGGALINISFKTGAESVTGDVVEITEQGEGNVPELDTYYGQPVLAPNSFYYLYPEQISINSSTNTTSIFFGCKTNYPYGKGIVELSATKNATTGLYENPTAKLSGEAFYVNNNIVYRYYFQGIDLLEVPLAHLTIRFTYYPD